MEALDLRHRSKRVLHSHRQRFDLFKSEPGVAHHVGQLDVVVLPADLQGLVGSTAGVVPDRPCQFPGPSSGLGLIAQLIPSEIRRSAREGMHSS